MKQSDNPEEFYKKFGFNLTMSRKSPHFPEEKIRFDGLEAKYVSDLEFDNENLMKHLKELRDRIFWLQEKEYRKTFAELDKESK